MPQKSPQPGILLVEDESAFREQIAEAALTLTSPRKLWITSNGKEFINCVQDNAGKIDLALIDLGLPDIDGLTLLRQLRDEYPQVISLVISVMSNRDAVISAIQAGAKGYVLKGETADSIGDAIANVLKGNYPISPSIARYLFQLAEPKGDADSLHPVPKSLPVSTREIETLRHIASGRTYAETAAAMDVSLSTVQSHIRSIYKKLGTHSQVQAVNRARSIGLI